MTFSQAVSSGFRRYLDFRTRSSRSEYWWWTLFGLLVSIVSTILDEVLFGGAAILDTISAIVLLIPGLAVGIRRLHDVNRSGWWILIAFTIVGIIYPLLYWNVQRGTLGANKYGPDPLGSPDDGLFEGFPGVPGDHDGHSFCGECGSAVESDANFCLSCGAAV